jgi:hypothetical protein
MSREETREPTVKQVARDLEFLVVTHAPTDADRVLLAAPLLGLGTRTEWRDAFFYADIDGEYEPDDYRPIPIALSTLTLSELELILFGWGLWHRIDQADRRVVVRALLTLGSAQEWALSLATETRNS